MSSIASVKTAVHNVFSFWGKERLRRYLLATRSDCLLIDSGFSPELLKQGVTAWPWRISDTSVALQNQPRFAEKPAAALYHGDIEYVSTDPVALPGQLSQRAA